MKNKNLSPIMILLIVLFSACSTNAPNSVTDAFNSMFPNATDIEWKMEEERQWEAEFTMDGVSYSSCFSESGDWLETEMAVGILDLPDTVLKVLAMHYEGFEIDEVEWLETPDFKGYELELEKEGETEEELELMITAQGKVIMEKREDADAEEDEDEEGDEHENDHDHEDGDSDMDED